MNFQKEASSDTKHKRKIIRRHGACIECQKSKIKCDGDRPCGTCRTAKRKPKDCKYSSKAERAKSRRSHQCDSPLIRKPRDGQINHSNPSHSTSQRSRLPTSIGPSESAIQDPYSTIGNPLDWMCRPLVLSSIVEEYSTLVCPKPSHSPLFDCLRGCAKELRDHIDSSRKQAKSQNGVHQPSAEVKRPTQSLSPDCVATVWEDRLTTLQGRIENGELSRAQRNVISLKKDIENYITGRGRAAQVSSDIQNEAVAMLGKLLELDYMLAMFLERQSIPHFWRRPGLLRPMLDHIKEGKSHSSGRIDLLETLQVGAKLNIPDESCVFKFVSECLAVRPKQSPTQSSCITPYLFIDNFVAEQDLKLFSSLFLMMLYCRTAVIERYCNHRKSQQGKSVRISNATASVNGKIQAGAPRAKSIEHQFIVKHANHALVAFRSLCESDRRATAKSWFRLHGALMAALVVSIASVQKGKAVNESNFTETMPAVRECFKNLEEVNPGCIVFQQAATVFDELAKFQRRSSKTLEVEISPDMHANAAVSQINCAVTNPHPFTTEVEESIMNYENPVLPTEQYRHPGPPYANPLPFDMIHPPMTLPQGCWSTEGALPTGLVWYGSPTGMVENTPMGNCASSQVLVQQVPQAHLHNLGAEMSPPSSSTGHPRFVNMTAENFEKDVATDVLMLVEGAGQMSQAQHGSSLESLATAQTIPNQSCSLTPPWQGYYPSQDSTCASEFQKFALQGNLYAQGSGATYPTLSDMTEPAPNSVPWMMNDSDQQYNQLNVAQGSTTCW